MFDLLNKYMTMQGPIGLSEYSDIWSAAVAPRKSSVPSNLLTRLQTLLCHVRDHGFFTLRIWGVLIQGLCNLQLRQLELLLKSCELYTSVAEPQRRRSVGQHTRAPRTTELAQSLDVNFTQAPIADDLLLGTQPFGTPTLHRLAAALEAGLSPSDAVEDAFALPPVDGDSFMAELRRLSAEFTPSSRHGEDFMAELRLDDPPQQDHLESANAYDLTPKRPRRGSLTTRSPPSTTRPRRAPAHGALETLPSTAFLPEKLPEFRSVEFYATATISKLGRLLSSGLAGGGNLPRLSRELRASRRSSDMVDILRDDEIEPDVFSAYPRRISVLEGPESPSPVKFGRQHVMGGAELDGHDEGDLLASLSQDADKRSRTFDMLVPRSVNNRRAAVSKFVALLGFATKGKVELKGSDFTTLTVKAVTAVW
jgi:hypothetical protein